MARKAACPRSQEVLLARTNELLAALQESARADRDAGRLVWADQQDELVQCVAEYVSWASSHILSLEHALLMQCASGQES